MSEETTVQVTQADRELRNQVIAYAYSGDGIAEIEAQIDEALARHRIAAEADSVMGFACSILHGSKKHRAWLLKAADCWMAGQDTPPEDESSQIAEAGKAELVEVLEVMTDFVDRTSNYVEAETLIEAALAALAKAKGGAA